MSSTSSPIPNSSPVSSTTPTTETSSVSPQPTPPRLERPGYTVVNNSVELKLFLDTVVRHISLPPKLFSQVLRLPPPQSSLEPPQGSGILREPTLVPPKLFDVPVSIPELYVDAEGISLSRTGELSILIVHVETRSFSHTYLIHVHVLKHRTFNMHSSDGCHSLRSIFQDNRIPKVFFDCRMDSDALFGQYGVLIQGIIDLQLMCLAVQGGGRMYLPGLEACLLKDLDIDVEERALVSQAKKRGKALWSPKLGGSMERFNDDPLHEDIISYCVVDTAYLPRLFEAYAGIGNSLSLMAVDDLWGDEDAVELSDDVFSWRNRILKESRLRAQKALDPDFTGGSAYNPWHQWKMYDDDDDW
ncbi:MAG: hypothetical protein HETSPECPRED_007913 [Heterodermia speciosa]|uniref:3'-5' exonuclease domain-containing protein n=1 Tax=Heterodermia speciosa TaxID=116794 RepID=A0A8H3I7H8_9LECA|nr:MAG: hypothetical protein HETSPECPRED_007913 [Heterodermia speciosa]